MFSLRPMGSSINHQSMKNRSTIHAHQFNSQLDPRSITKQTNIHAEIWTGVLHDWKSALYQLSYQPLTTTKIYFAQTRKFKIILYPSVNTYMIVKGSTLDCFRDIGWVIEQSLDPCFRASISLTIQKVGGFIHVYPSTIYRNLLN
jgi:hypothetical protein